MTNEDIAYIAGIIDGDGSIVVYRASSEDPKES